MSRRSSCRTAVIGIVMGVAAVARRGSCGTLIPKALYSSSGKCAANKSPLKMVSSSSEEHQRGMRGGVQGTGLARESSPHFWHYRARVGLAAWHETCGEQ